MLDRKIYLRTVDGADAPAAAADLERDGYAVLRGAFSADEVAELRSEISSVFDAMPGDVRQPERGPDHAEQFRYEMINRSAAVQRLAADRRILDVLEPVLGPDCHVIACTAWRNPPKGADDPAAGPWHLDAGPHVPRPAGVPWDDRIPYPIFAVGVHVLLEDCPPACGPTEVIPGSHRSGQHPPFESSADDDLTCDGVGGVLLDGAAGDVSFFTSDTWHRRGRTADGDTGRFFQQLHYGRRDLAQRMRTTATSNQLSDDAIARAEAGDHRDRSVIGLHRPFFYDG